MHPIEMNIEMSVNSVHNSLTKVWPGQLSCDSGRYIYDILERDGDRPSGDKPGKMSGARRRNTNKLKLNITSDNNKDDNCDNKTPMPSPNTVRETVISFGFSEAEVNTGIHRVQESGQTICYESVLDSTMKVRRERLRISLLGGASNVSPPIVEPPGDQEVSCEEESDPETPPDVKAQRLERAKKRLLEEKKQELVAAIEKMTYLCKMCNDKEATILLLPCAHLVCCESCLMDVRRCPIPRCNRVVRGTKEVFFA